MDIILGYMVGKNLWELDFGLFFENNFYINYATQIGVNSWNVRFDLIPTQFWAQLISL